jgi:hypothetical protein
MSDNEYQNIANSTMKVVASDLLDVSEDLKENITENQKTIAELLDEEEKTENTENEQTEQKE